MNILKINKTPKTPDVEFNPTTGVFLISGISVPENSMEFYSSIITWLNEYIQNPVETTKLIFKLSYLNTSPLQFLYDFLIILDGIHTKT